MGFRISRIKKDGKNLVDNAKRFKKEEWGNNRAGRADSRTNYT